MFNRESTIFVSTPEFLIGNVPMMEVQEKINKKVPHYALSFHSGFRQYDYAQIDRIETSSSEATIRMIRLEVQNPKGVVNELICAPNVKVYTRNNSWVPAEEIDVIDILVDGEDYNCKMLTKTNLRRFKLLNVAKAYVLFNKSAFINNILVRTD